MNFNIEDRIQQAIENFESGYNCSQAVFLAYADLFDLDKELANKISVSFGGGVGRMREVCGAVSAMALLTGFRYPASDPTNLEERMQNYKVVQQMADTFKEKYKTIICRDLLKIKPENNPWPSLRTKEYYEQRPCARFVEEAARITGEMLKGNLEELS